MPNEQLEIPGMPPQGPPKPKKLSAQQQIADLQSRVLKLEVEVLLLQIGDKNHG